MFVFKVLIHHSLESQNRNQLRFRTISVTTASTGTDIHMITIHNPPTGITDMGPVHKTVSKMSLVLSYYMAPQSSRLQLIFWLARVLRRPGGKLANVQKTNKAIRTQRFQTKTLEPRNWFAKLGKQALSRNCKCNALTSNPQAQSLHPGYFNLAIPLITSA